MATNKVEFQCKQCGHCCRRDGFVFLTTEDLHNLMDHFQLDYSEFKDKYLNTYQRKLILKERPEGGCIFSREKNGLCPIYAVRPEQCRTYPYWDVVRVDEDWLRKESQECPGIII